MSDRELDARVDALRDRLEQERPASWVPKREGDEIVGELVRFDRGKTAYGEQVIAVLRTPEGVERSVWLLHAVLRQEFAKLQPELGELVLIRYEGKREPEGDGSSYQHYRLEVEREDGPIDWSELGAEAESELNLSTTPGAPLEEKADRGADDEIPF